MKMREEIINVVSKVLINGAEFDCWGVSNHDISLHILIRQQEGYNADDVIAAVKAGDDPIRVFNKAGALVYVFERFTQVEKIMVDYGYKFTPTDTGIAIQVVIGRGKVTPDDITDLQMAVAELAELIGGGDSNG